MRLEGRLAQDSLQIWRIAVPMMIAYLSVPLMGLVDTAVMGHLGSATYLGGLGLGANFFSFFYFMFAFIRWSTSGLTANERGREEIDGNRGEKEYVLLRSLALGVAFGLAIIALRRPITDIALDFMGARGDVRLEALRYCSGRILSAPALLGTYAITGWLIGCKRPKGILLITILANLVNALALLVLVIGLGWGTLGAGYATALAEYSGLIAGLFYVLGRTPFSVTAFTADRLLKRSALLSLFSLNTNVFLKTLLTSFVFYYFLRSSAQLSPAALAANLVLLQMFYLASYLLDGFSNACEVLAGHAQGANDRRRIGEVFTASIVSAAGTGAIIGLIYVLAGGFVVRGISNMSTVVQLADEYRAWMAILPPFMGAAFVLEGLLIGTLQMKSLRDAAALGAGAFLIVNALVPQGWENHGLWFSMLAYLSIRPAIGFWLFSKRETAPAT